MIDPIGTLTLKGHCFNIDIFADGDGKNSVAMQIQDEHLLIWRVHLGCLNKLQEDDDEYFIKLMTTENLTVRIKILDVVCDKAYPRSYYCDFLKCE